MVRILLIDDDDDFRSMLRMALEQDGYVVEEARNGLEGSQRQRTEPVDLVITDILMPEQEGLETIQALRQEFPEIKIIAISGGVGMLNFLPLAAPPDCALFSLPPRAWAKSLSQMDFAQTTSHLHDPFQGSLTQRRPPRDLQKSACRLSHHGHAQVAATHGTEGRQRGEPAPPPPQ